MLRTVLPLAAAAVAMGQVQCDADSACVFEAKYKGSSYVMDFRRLCNAGQDYMLADSIGHTYYAQICGTAAKSCLPKDWENEYEYGRVIQTWSDPPPCDPTDPPCVEERTGAEVCCTEPCQVIAVATPSFTEIVPGDASQGVQLTYMGETPTLSDPYQCDWNPATGSPFPRVTHLQFFCDPNQQGFASMYAVDQNATDDCEYTVKFKTDLVCVTGLPISGGWIFNIIFLTCFGLYAIIGTGINFYKHRTCEFPNKAFWAELESLVFDGVRFIRYGCRKPPPRGAQKLSGSGTPFGSQSYNASSADSRALFSGTASSSSSSSSSASGTSGYDGADPTPAASAPTVSAASGYNAIGGSSSSAYTDL